MVGILVHDNGWRLVRHDGCSDGLLCSVCCVCYCIGLQAGDSEMWINCWRLSSEAGAGSRYVTRAHHFGKAGRSSLRQVF